MGRRFVGHYGGKGLIYYCRRCDTYLTSQVELTSPHFNSSTGSAKLFFKVWNIYEGQMETRKMTTGWHIVRDVMCVVCKSRLGWMYEMASEPSQEYKERQVILEDALIVGRDPGFEDPLGADEKAVRHKPPVPHLERPRRFSRRSRTQNSTDSSRSGSESNTSVSSLSSNTSV